MIPLCFGLAQQTNRFDSWDKNKAGKLTKEELPQQLQKNFARVDKNGDGSISRDEDGAARKRRNPKNDLSGIKSYRIRTTQATTTRNRSSISIFPKNRPPKDLCPSFVGFMEVVGAKVTRRTRAASSPWFAPANMRVFPWDIA